MGPLRRCRNLVAIISSYFRFCRRRSTTRLPAGNRNLQFLNTQQSMPQQAAGRMQTGLSVTPKSTGAIKAQPPTWAGADWNPRAQAQAAPTSGAKLMLHPVHIISLWSACMCTAQATSTAMCAHVSVSHRWPCCHVRRDGRLPAQHACCAQRQRQEHQA